MQSSRSRLNILLTTVAWIGVLIALLLLVENFERELLLPILVVVSTIQTIHVVLLYVPTKKETRRERKGDIHK